MRTRSRNISLQICGKLWIGGHEVGGDEVPEGEEGDEGGQQGAREQEDLVRGELHGGETEHSRHSLDLPSQCSEDNAAHW